MPRTCATASYTLGLYFYTRMFYQLVFFAILLLLVHILFLAPASLKVLKTFDDEVGCAPNFNPQRHTNAGSPSMIGDRALKAATDRMVAPVDNKAKPVQATAKAVPAKAKPVQAKAKPVQAKAKPVQAKAKPVQAKAKPVQAKAKPVQAKAKPVHAEAKAANNGRRIVHQIKQPKPIKAQTHRHASIKSSSKEALPPDIFSIPNILHHTFSSEMVYENYRPMINSCLSLNPNWTYYLWRDSDAMALIAKHYPQYLKTYRGFKDNLQRSDAIRYIILHRFGGIYLDMDVECVKPFHPTLTQHTTFIDQERLEQTRILWKRPFSAMNSVMGSVPQHIFFQNMADRVLKAAPRSNYAFYSTGPVPLTDAYKQYKDNPSAWIWPVTLLPPSVTSPLMDAGHNWKGLCRKSKKSGNLNWLDVGCRMLEAKHWSLGSVDNSTIVVHRFMHLGYSSHKRQRRRLLNITKEFSSRVKFYA